MFQLNRCHCFRDLKKKSLCKRLWLSLATQSSWSCWRGTDRKFELANSSQGAGQVPWRNSEERHVIIRSGVTEKGAVKKKLHQQPQKRMLVQFFFTAPLSEAPGQPGRKKWLRYSEQNSNHHPHLFICSLQFGSV